jgi:archaemetzincin
LVAESGSEPLAEVVPLGRVPSVACGVVAANLQAVMGLATAVLGERVPPLHALLPARGQVDAAPLLAALAADLAPHRLRVGVTEADLCLPILTYVYGEARVGGRVAVVSTARLAGDISRVEPAVGLERLAKVALHEAAHALGLTHCAQEGCLMVFSAGLDRLDRLYLRFCPACEHRLALSIREIALRGAP